MKYRSPLGGLIGIRGNRDLTGGLPLLPLGYRYPWGKGILFWAQAQNRTHVLGTGPKHGPHGPKRSPYFVPRPKIALMFWAQARNRRGQDPGRAGSANSDPAPLNFGPQPFWPRPFGTQPFWPWPCRTQLFGPGPFETHSFGTRPFGTRTIWALDHFRQVLG